MIGDERLMEYPFDPAEPGELLALHNSLMRLREVANAIKVATGNPVTPQKLGVAILGNHTALARSKPATFQDLLTLTMHALECMTVLAGKHLVPEMTAFWLLVLESTLKNLREGLEKMSGERTDGATIYRDLNDVLFPPPESNANEK